MHKKKAPIPEESKLVAAVNALLGNIPELEHSEYRSIVEKLADVPNVAWLFDSDWTPHNGGKVSPESMTYDRLVNTLNYAQGHARVYKDKYEYALLARLTEEHSTEPSVIEEINRLAVETPMEWLSRMPVYQSLVREKVLRLSGLKTKFRHLNKKTSFLDPIDMCKAMRDLITGKNN